MAVTVEASPVFPDGTVVKAYLGTNNPPGATKPLGGFVGNQTVVDGSLTYSNLDIGKSYVLFGLVSGSYRRMDVSLEIESGAKGVINHGTLGSAPRPQYASVEWVGSAEPENARDGDTWVQG